MKPSLRLIIWKPALFCLLLCLFVAVASSFGQEIALTFDDLPAHAQLPPGVTREDVAKQIIKALEDAHAPKSYGFMNAEKLQQAPEDVEVLKLWRAAGLPLGNHSYSHMDLNANSVEAFEHDIQVNEPLLQCMMQGEDWRWFRYPYLTEGETLKKRRALRSFLTDHGYRVAEVTVDFSDYAWNAPYARCAAKKDAKAIEQLKASYLSTAAEYISLGQEMAKLVYGRDVKHVLLLHVGAFDAVMLPQLIDLLKQRGFKLVTLQQAESDPAYESDPDLGLKMGKSLLEQMMQAKHLQVPPHKEKPFKELEFLCREPSTASHN
jgi:peptidoglycan/xylan/chitin deacetylase (PgdA/CDA1 family)